MKKLKRLFVMVMCLLCASCTAVFFACDDGDTTDGSGSDNTSTENTDNSGSGSNTPTTATVSSVTISSADNATSVVEGSTLQLTATVTMNNSSTYTGTVTWASDTESVATVSSTGLVTGVAAGTAKITATADSVTSTEFTIEVTEASTPATVSSVTLSETSASIEEDATVTLIATVTMSDNSTYAGDISWESSDTAVATVSGGTVTGVAEGTATITATAGEKSATCTVTVTAKSSTINLSYSISDYYSALSATAEGATTSYISTYSSTIYFLASGAISTSSQDAGVLAYTTTTYDDTEGATQSTASSVSDKGYIQTGGKTQAANSVYGRYFTIDLSDYVSSGYTVSISIDFASTGNNKTRYILLATSNSENSIEGTTVLKYAETGDGTGSTSVNNTTNPTNTLTYEAIISENGIYYIDSTDGVRVYSVSITLTQASA